MRKQRFLKKIFIFSEQNFHISQKQTKKIVRGRKIEKKRKTVRPKKRLRDASSSMPRKRIQF